MGNAYTASGALFTAKQQTNDKNGSFVGLRKASRRLRRDRQQ